MPAVGRCNARRQGVEQGPSLCCPRPQERPKTTILITRPPSSPIPISGYMSTLSLPVCDRTQIGIQRATRLWKAATPNFSHWVAMSGERYTLFSSNCRPFHEYMAPALPSPPLNAFPSSISSPLTMKVYHIMRSLHPLHTR